MNEKTFNPKQLPSFVQYTYDAQNTQIYYFSYHHMGTRPDTYFMNIHADGTIVYQKRDAYSENYRTLSKKTFWMRFNEVLGE
jgi:hypothetical protein